MPHFYKKRRLFFWSKKPELFSACCAAAEKAERKIRIQLLRGEINRTEQDPVRDIHIVSGSHARCDIYPQSISPWWNVTSFPIGYIELEMKKNFLLI